MSDNFRPFIDYDALSDDMINDLHELMTANYAAQRRFAYEKSKRNAVGLLRASNDLTGCIAAINQTLWTEPAMIHVAGTRRTESDETGDEITVQNCSRCGTRLCAWKEGACAMMTPDGPQLIAEDEWMWWDVGQRVAKTMADDETHAHVRGMRDDEELTRYEYMCPDFAEQFRE